MIGRRLRHGRRREQDATKERDAERVGAAAHRLPCLLGCRCIVAVRASRASIISFRLLNGRLKTGRAVARTMPKFSAAAKRCRTGRPRYSRSSSLFSWSQPISRLRSASGSRHQAGSEVTFTGRPSGVSIGCREMTASSVRVPYWPNRNHVVPRMPPHPNVATPRVNARPGWNFSPVCWTIQGVMASTISPWIVQQTGEKFHPGLAFTLGVATFGWIGIRGMTWFLFGQYGTPPLLAVISRQPMDTPEGRPVKVASEPAWWREPLADFKKEIGWLHA